MGNERNLYVHVVKKKLILCMISDFCRDTDDTCALLGNYAAYSGNSLPTFRGNLSVPSSSVKKSKYTLRCVIPQKSAV